MCSVKSAAAPPSSPSLLIINMMDTINVNALAISCHCCIQLLLFLMQLLPCTTAASTNATDHAGYSTSCASRPVMECANLGSISYPFWGSTECAASPSYVFSNCTTSSPHAYWDSFSAAVPAEQYGAGLHRTPLVVNLSQSSYLTWIDLTWNTSFLSMDVCALPYFPSQTLSELSQYNVIPGSINLTGFASSTFSFSGLTTFLLFNCTNNIASNVSQLNSQYNYNDYFFLGEAGGSVCSTYKQLCKSSLAETSCIGVVASGQEFMLQHLMDTLSCSHFTFGLSTRQLVINDYRSAGLATISEYWNAGVVRLTWTSSECMHCTGEYGGFCAFDIPLNPSKLSGCTCSNGRIVDLDTQSHCHPVCYDGFLRCHPISGIFTLVAVPLLAIIMLALVAVYFGGKIRKGILNVFSMKLAPIAIAMLKRTVKQLQALSYRPSHQLGDMDLEGLTERPVEYSYSSIASATKSFSSVVGEGGFGVVYKGTLLDLHASCPQRDSRKCQIAVKVLETRSRHRKKQFLNEVATIGRIHHLNVVRLLGFCMQEDHEMLVYEYVANGSLDKWLFDNSTGKQVLDWGQRYAIAVGIAKGLSYLHEECRHRTVHCDIKPHNILLDEEMCPKIADFGLARLMGREESQVVTIAKGTPGYMAPEFWMGGESQLSTKFDVYSYGMVLLELMSGCRNFTCSGSCFPAVAFEAAMQGDFDTILDARLGITMYSMPNTSDEAADEAQRLQRNQIRTAAFVALWCIQDQPASRPCMTEVVQYLDGVAAVREDPPQPTISISNTSLPPHQISNIRTTHQHDFTPISMGR